MRCAPLDSKRSALIQWQLLENILLETLDPYDVIAFGRTCKRIYALSQEEVLFKRMYQRTWDKTAQNANVSSCKVVCQSRARAFHNVANYTSYDSDNFPAIRKAALSALVGIAETTSSEDESISAMRLQALFATEEAKLVHWLGLHMHSPWQVKPLFERPRSHSTAAPSPELIDRNKLLCYAGVTPYTKAIRLALRGPAREAVYRKSDAVDASLGPFLKESDKVDWRLLGSIAIVMYLSESSHLVVAVLTARQMWKIQCLSGF